MRKCCLETVHCNCMAEKNIHFTEALLLFANICFEKIVQTRYFRQICGAQLYVLSHF